MLILFVRTDPTPERDVYQLSRSALDLVREVLCSSVMILCYAYFLYTQLGSIGDYWRWDVLLFVGKISLEIIFYLTRRFPKEVATSPYAWIITLFAVFVVMYMHPAVHPSPSLFGLLLLELGLLIHILALLSLGRSFGVLPANRGLKTRGLYRFVRHPLYTSVVLSMLGYLLCNPSLYNLGVFILGTILHILRLLEEERLLSRDSAYESFKVQTPWRLIPWVF